MKTLILILSIGVSTALALAAETPIVINEICSSNIDQWTDLSFNYGGWVEFYNPSETSVNITNWRFSDDPNDLQKARLTQTNIVPSHGYKIVWFDNYHPRYSPKTVDMKLDLDGGTLYVSDADGNLLLQQDYPAAIGRCSWARTEDAGNVWSYCSNPSLGKSNLNHKYAEERLNAPEVNCESKVFKSGTINVKVTIPEGCTLRYTTDGSAPTLTNGSTSTDGAFAVTATRRYRFRLFRDGYLPSEVVSRSFIKTTYNIDLPILSISGTQRNFYSDSIGIFVKGGINGRPGRGQSSKCNWNMDWERPAVFEYFTADGQTLYNQETGIERCGGWSRAWDPMSFKIKANKRYEGRKHLEYPFFAEKPYLRHKTLQIRNGGNDNVCRVRDPFLQRIIASTGINIDYQAYQPVAHFVNGTWKGTINMREPNNKHFVYANYGLDDEELDTFEMSPDSGYVQTCGDDEAWKRLMNYAKQAGSTQGYYEKVCELLDIEEYCNYMAIELYLQNWDWPQNNIKAWRPRRDEQGRFRFILMDLDGFDGTNTTFTTFAGKQTYTFDYLYDLNKRYTKEIEFVTLFLKLLEVNQFRERFINTFTLVAYSIFEPSRCKAIIEELANIVAPTQGQGSSSSPWSTANLLISALSSSRQSNLMNQLKNYSKMGLTGKSLHNANISANIAEARLTFNGLPIPLNRFDGRYFNTATVTASAPACYQFTGWKLLEANEQLLFAENANWSYYDQGSLDGKNWQQATYDDSKWKTGAAPLGYYTDGQRDYRTTLDYGTNKSNKRPTYYFRLHFNVDETPTPNDIFSLNYKIDDGVVIYVNGEEAVRYNMPTGNITYNTYASTYAPENPDTGTMQLPSSLFKQGENVIAVELHNNSASSTDVYWCASLQHSIYSGGEIVCFEPEYTLPSSGNTSVIACFEPIAPSQQISPIVINEVSAGNDVYVCEYLKKNDWIELYNTTDNDFDLTGCYLTDRTDKPYKYQISTEGTQATAIIPAHGYKIIWCDKLDTDTQIHASFKLDNDDKLRSVMITAADGSWSDTLSYYRHGGNESVGRYPDGSRNVYWMNRPSIDRTNELTIYSQPIEQPLPEAIQRVIDDNICDEYRVFDLAGRLICNGYGSFRDNILNTGIYIVREGHNTIKVQIP